MISDTPIKPNESLPSQTLGATEVRPACRYGASQYGRGTFATKPKPDDSNTPAEKTSQGDAE